MKKEKFKLSARERLLLYKIRSYYVYGRERINYLCTKATLNY